MTPIYTKNKFSGLDLSTTCPVSGFAVTSKPEWEHIDLGEGYSVSFKLIGKQILLSIPAGNSGIHGMDRFLEERDNILRTLHLFDNQYIEIKDYGRVSGVASKDSRMAFTNHLRNERTKDNLLGYFGFNAPVFIRFAFNVGLKLHKPTFPVTVVNDYRTAMTKAVHLLKKQGVTAPHFNRFSKEDWSVTSEEYSVGFELVGNDILHNYATGTLTNEAVDIFYDLLEKVLHESGLAAKGYYYRITDWEKLESTKWVAKTIYLKRLKQLNQKIPCRFSALFGMNPLMKSLFNTGKMFVPFHIAVVDNFEDAREPDLFQ